MQIALEEQPKSDDTELSKEGINFLIGEKHLPYFKNVKLDFVKGVFGNGQFKLLQI